MEDTAFFPKASLKIFMYKHRMSVRLSFRGKNKGDREKKKGLTLKLKCVLFNLHYSICAI